MTSAMNTTVTAQVGSHERGERSSADSARETQEYVLRAMAANYAGGHSWDHLDGETCVKAADEIKRLRGLDSPVISTKVMRFSIRIVSPPSSKRPQRRRCRRRRLPGLAHD